MNMKLSEIGINNLTTEVAEPPKCGNDCDTCKQPECSSVIMGKSFKSQEEVINFALGVCEEWECPHTFAFIRFKNNMCAVALHEMTDDESVEEYEWRVYRVQWKDIEAIRQYNEQENQIHFAIVIQENKDGDFAIITK